MDQNLKSVVEKRIERTMKALEHNGMSAMYAPTAADVLPLVRQLLRKGETVGIGGSMTLFETGVIEHLRGGNYHFLDTRAEGLTKDELWKMYREAFSADSYISSTNAVTEDGWLLNVDGTGNRVGAMVFGPKQVILIAGYNKIVKDIPAAFERLKQVASPANCIRLSCKTPCTQTGHCMNCNPPGRICCDYVLMGYQRTPERVKVILVGEEVGY